jgi:hypothetical protein
LPAETTTAAGVTFSAAETEFTAARVEADMASTRIPLCNMFMSPMFSGKSWQMVSGTFFEAAILP